MIRLVTNILGVFALKDDRIINKKLFSQDPSDIAERLVKIENDVCDEEIHLLKELRKTNVREIFVKNPSRFWGHKLDIEFKEDTEHVDVFRIADEIGADKNEVKDLIAKVNLELTREKLKVVSRDQIVIQAVECLDDIDESINTLIERLREWYSIHYPELDNIVSDHRLYAKLINDLGNKKNFTEGKLKLESNLSTRVSKSVEESLGADFNENDIEAVKSFSDIILNLYEVKEKIEEYIAKIMKETAPNISELAGPVLGARIISLAGGLDRLSILPAGTIQLLGAEDAFFRFLKTKKRPPKHGIIFQLPEIRSSPRNIRGKISRTFAAKLALASRADKFKGSFIGDKLKKDFEKRVQSLK